MAALEVAWACPPVLRRIQQWLQWLALLALVASQPISAANRSNPLREYQIKAIFLYHFAQFVEWPSETFASEQSPIVLGVLGEGPIGADLEHVANGEKVGHRSLEVRRFQRVEDVATCHVLFISQSEDSRMDRILARLHGHSILTVSDTEGFTRLGGMIRFVTENNRIKIRINLEAATRARLTLSSKLLRLAENTP